MGLVRGKLSPGPRPSPEGNTMTHLILNGDCLDELRSIADASVDSVVTDPPEINDLEAGTAAEHLVCADLLLSGWRAFMTEQMCPYDVAVEIDGRLVRVQVKSTRSQRAIPQRVNHIPAYMWHVRRAGKGGRRSYSGDEFDILALVALDIRRIAYMPPSGLKQTVHIRPPGSPGGKQFDHYPFQAALEELS